MINYEYKNPLTEKEKKEVLKQFKNYLESNKNTLEIKENGIDPFKENCYISNNDVISGIYFPNNEIIIKEGSHRDLFYDFVCIGKNNRGELGYYAQLKPEKYNENGAPLGALCENIFKPFIKINENYFKIKNEMNEALKDYESNLNILKSFKVVTKKDGSMFKDYNKNFIFTSNQEEKSPIINCDRSYSYNYIYSIEIFFNYNYKIRYYLTEEEKEKQEKKFYKIEDLYTPNDLYNKIILKEIEETQKKIQELKKNLKDLLKDFLKIEKKKFNYEKEKEKYYKNNYFLNDFMCIKY